MNLFPRRSFFRKPAFSLTLILLTGLILPVSHTASANPDTTWSVTFSVNMTRAVKEHIFRPDSDFVFVGLDQGIPPLKLVEGPGDIYSGTLYNELDSNTTYHYKFRINDAIWETVTRQVTTAPGMVSLSDWWNDIPINYTSFVVNMQYAVQYGMFNPASDSVTIVGSMNGWQGSPKMEQMGSTLNYYTVYNLDPGSVQEFKYRINRGDTALQQLELLYKPNRVVRVPDTLLEVRSDFNNYNPARRLMTFRCNMGYCIGTHRFYPATDYVDVAGNFNNGGANDVLFNSGNDSIYSLDLFLDTAYFSNGPLAFRFRINGDWEKAELQGKPNRQYAFHDTTGQNPNLFSCWYNDWNPGIPAPPWAYGLSIQGEYIHKNVVTGIYSYENVNGIPEGKTVYDWFRSFDAVGDSVLHLDTVFSINYLIDTLDIGKWLIFQVTPKAAYGDSVNGKSVRYITPTPVGGVGLDEFALVTRIYPNPANDLVTLEARKEIERIMICGLDGKTIYAATGLRSKGVRISVAHLAPGLYLVRAFATDGQQGTARLIRQ